MSQSHGRVGVAGGLDGRQLLGQLGEDRADLAPGELGAEAEVGADAEREELVGVGTGDVEAHGIDEDVLVAVGRRVREQDPPALGDGHAADLGVALGVVLTGDEGDGGWLLAGTLDREALVRAAQDVLSGFVYVEDDR